MKYNINEIYDWPFPPKAVFIVAVCLVILGLGYYFDFSDITAKLHRLERQESDTLIQYTSLASDTNTFKKELAKYELLTTTLNAYQKNIISPGELPELLNEIIKIGRQNELVFNQFDPGPETKDGSYTKLVIKTVILGTYDQIANFISQVANMDKTVGIGNFVIQKKTAETPTEQPAMDNRLTAELNLVVYEVKKS